MPFWPLKSFSLRVVPAGITSVPVAVPGTARMVTGEPIWTRALCSTANFVLPAATVKVASLWQAPNTFLPILVQLFGMLILSMDSHP